MNCKYGIIYHLLVVKVFLIDSYEKNPKKKIEEEIKKCSMK